LIFFDLGEMGSPLPQGCKAFVYAKKNSTFQGVEMTAELIAQLATLFLILGAGPIIVVFLYARGGNL